VGGWWGSSFLQFATEEQENEIRKRRKKNGGGSGKEGIKSLKGGRTYLYEMEVGGTSHSKEGQVVKKYKVLNRRWRMRRVHRNEILHRQCRVHTISGKGMVGK